eukprot:PhM_4_TR15251/c1_g1_i2/m.8449
MKICLREEEPTSYAVNPRLSRVVLSNAMLSGSREMVIFVLQKWDFAPTPQISTATEVFCGMGTTTKRATLPTTVGLHRTQMPVFFEDVTVAHVFALFGDVKRFRNEVMCHTSELLQKDLFLIDGTGKTPAHYAALAGHVHFLKYLQTMHSDIITVVDSAGMSPLHVAAFKDNVECVQLLLLSEDGKLLLTGLTSSGLGCAHFAAMSGGTRVLRFLAATFDARVEFTRHGREDQFPLLLSPLALAVRTDVEHVVQYLVNFYSEEQIADEGEELYAQAATSRCNIINHTISYNV